MELFKNTMIVEAFATPEELQKKGFSGQAMASKLIDEFTSIRSVAQATRKKVSILPAWHQEPSDVTILGSKFSLKAFADYLKRLIGKDLTHITGEASIKDSIITLTVRSAEHASITTVGTAEKLDTMLFEAAKEMLLTIEPYVVAVYLFDRGNMNEAEEAVKYCLRHDPPDDDPWAYNAWGAILAEGKQYDKAIMRFKNCLDLDSTDEYAHYNWGYVLYDQHKIPEAIEKFEKVLKLNPKAAVAYNGWGVCLEYEGDNQGAIIKYEEAIEMDPKMPEPYYNVGNVYYKMGEYEKVLWYMTKYLDLKDDSLVASWLDDFIAKRAKKDDDK